MNVRVVEISPSVSCSSPECSFERAESVSSALVDEAATTTNERRKGKTH
jgi:hypothetical protein